MSAHKTLLWFMVNSHFLFKIHMYNLYWGLQAWHTLHQQWSAWNFSMQYLCNKSFSNKTVCTNALFYTIVTQRHASPFAELPHIAVATAMVKITVSCTSCIFSYVVWLDSGLVPIAFKLVHFFTREASALSIYRQQAFPPFEFLLASSWRFTMRKYWPIT